MRATISRRLRALKQRRSSDEGFSLIELIVVVAILGILVAIAIPVFGSIQDTARVNSLKAAAANGATAVAAAVADSDSTSTPAGAISAANTNSEITLALVGGTPDTVDDVCVSATGPAGWPAAEQAGPGCTGGGGS